MSELIEREAQELRAAAHALGDLLAEKCQAYGSAHNRQAAIWEALLAPYRKGDVYVFPAALMYHVPRLTRIFDRVLRIVANPTADRMGEDPWRDLAGDALAGVVMPKPARADGPGEGKGCPEFECALVTGHDGPHMKFDAAGAHRWFSIPTHTPDGEENPRGFDPALDVVEEKAPARLCGAHYNHTRGLRVCALYSGHAGPHVDMFGRADPSWKGGTP